MGIYILVFVIAFLYYLLAQGKFRQSPVLLALFMGYLTVFVGLGDMIGGYDRYIYGASFDAIADETWKGGNYARVVYLKNGIEWGYWIWQILMSFITENRYIFILLTTLLEYVLIYSAFRKYVDDYPLATIVFLGFFYYFSMTYLREVIAVGIAWQGINYAWERKPLKFFSILLLAATFHGSVLIFAIIYFLPQRKFSKSVVIYLLIFCFLLGMSPIPNAILSSAGEMTGKGDYADQDQGFRIEYVFETIFIIWILFSNYKFIRSDAKSLMFLNMCYTLCGVLMVFMRFGQGGRFAWPFLIGILYWFTRLADRKEASNWLKPVVIIVCFALFMRITYAWAALNAPYKTFLTNGKPAGNGSIYASYEYDYNYTQDKFYRQAFVFKSK